ncbi:hypothetical protein AAG906_022071 [Vitis piasezkii]
MNKEFNALLANGTWTLVPKPPYANLVDCKWVYKIKRKADGGIERFKAYLVTKGFHQQEGDGSIISSRGWHLRQIDIQNAFLHGVLQEDVYMIQPPRFIHPQLSHHVSCCRTTLRKDMGELSFFTGIEAIRSDHGLYLSQRHYILDLLIRSQMDKAKPCVTPMSTSQSLIKFAGIPFHDPHLYRSIVGGLQYLSFTRPDLAFAVHKVSKYMQNPMEPHWAVVKRILRYLKNTISHALLIQPITDLKLHTFSDADWAFDHGDEVFAHRSLCSNCPFSDSLVRQHRSNLFDRNPLFHALTKHIEINFHYVHDQVLRGQLHVQFVSTNDQMQIKWKIGEDGTAVVKSIK